MVLRHWESTESESKIKPRQQWCCLLCHFCGLVCPNSLWSINNNSSAPVFIIKMKTGISMSDSIFLVKHHYITTASRRGILQKDFPCFHFIVGWSAAFTFLGGLVVSNIVVKSHVSLSICSTSLEQHTRTSFASKNLTLLTSSLS